MVNQRFYTAVMSVCVSTKNQEQVRALIFINLILIWDFLLAPKSVFVAVMDGITLGHPCCTVHNCKIQLTTARDRFCAEHRTMNSVCAVKNCTCGILEGKRTCGDPVHQEIEHVHCVRGQARFQLQERLKRARVAHPNDAIAEDVDLATFADDDDEQAFELDEHNRVLPDLSPSPAGASEPPPTSTSPPQKRIAAQFGRKRTHNEQILVTPCGMILARETFYGAEAISTCVVSFSSYVCALF